MTPEEFQTLFAQFRELKQTAEKELAKLAKETEQWLPIDAAPKDGTILLLSGHHGGKTDNPNMWVQLGGWDAERKDWVRFPGSPVSDSNVTYYPPRYFLPCPAKPDPKSLPY